MGTQCLPGGFQKRLGCKPSFCSRFWWVYGAILGSLRPPFRHPGVRLASLGLPLDAFSEAFGSFCARNREAKPSNSPIKDLIASGGEISPRSCRDSAENVPRTLQEPAENPQYEHRANLKFALRLPRKDLAYDKRLE